MSIELEKLEDELKKAENNTSSLETQHEAAVAHNEQLANQVPNFIVVHLTHVTGNSQFHLVQVKKFEAELEDFHSTLDEMKKSLEEEKKSLEEEKNSKRNLQRCVKSLKEELAHRKELHKEGKSRNEEVSL